MLLNPRRVVPEAEGSGQVRHWTTFRSGPSSGRYYSEITYRWLPRYAPLLLLHHVVVGVETMSPIK